MTKLICFHIFTWRAGSGSLSVGLQREHKHASPHTDATRSPKQTRHRTQTHVCQVCLVFHTVSFPLSLSFHRSLWARPPSVLKRTSSSLSQVLFLWTHGRLSLSLRPLSCRLCSSSLNETVVLHDAWSSVFSLFLPLSSPSLPFSLSSVQHPGLKILRSDSSSSISSRIGWTSPLTLS